VLLKSELIEKDDSEKYECTFVFIKLDDNYFKGLEEIIENYIQSLGIHNDLTKPNDNTPGHKKSLKMIAQKSYDQLNLDALYDMLGHDSYTKLIIIYEKYLLHGRSVASVDLDYSQFKSFITSNKINNDQLSLKKCEILFNQVKRENCMY